ncbi:VOC family protein [Microbulbifer marinus]|uniref:Glyoxalase/Bleomycin resistance protein/Dioxygenase superfamily protein n=1 Tax=Microbulbifer marinus TaxID=658218 RepID=A0A1H3W9J5_9GAMM|nr:VOC family protein [Microbulbifer marinus]SDZ83640.1 Glyoxalase/Bleomycin resistance protein/Dioxygenase superfamily protein [Microbulbifer marinus]
MRLDHINISAPIDLLLEVRDFYCSVLGLREGHRPDFARSGFWLYADDQPLVHLVESNVHFESDSPHYLDHVAFRTENLNAVVDKLESLGVSYTKTHVPGGTMRQVFFRDPAGTGIEVNSNQ